MDIIKHSNFFHSIVLCKRSLVFGYVLDYLSCLLSLSLVDHTHKKEACGVSLLCFQFFLSPPIPEEVEPEEVEKNVDFFSTKPTCSGKPSSVKEYTEFFDFCLSNYYQFNHSRVYVGHGTPAITY